MKSLLFAAVAFAALIASARATTLPVLDGDFENPGNSSGPSSESGHLVGWTISGGEYYGIGGSGLPGGAFTGNNDAFINVNGAGNGSYFGSLTSDTFGTFDMDSTYTLKVPRSATASRADDSDYGSPGDMSFSLLANGVTLKTFSLPNGTLANDSGQYYTLTVDSADPLYSALAGHSYSLSVVLGATQQVAAPPIQSEFDNVSVTEVADAPEPATWAMLALGCAALTLALRRRGRAPLVCRFRAIRAYR